MNYQKARDVHVKKVGNRFVAFNLDTYYPVILNEMAARILLKSDGRQSVADLADWVHRHFDVSLEKARDDIGTLYTDLANHRLVEPME